MQYLISSISLFLLLAASRSKFSRAYWPAFIFAGWVAVDVFSHATPGPAGKVALVALAFGYAWAVFGILGQLDRSIFLNLVVIVAATMGVFGFYTARIGKAAWPAGISLKNAFTHSGLIDVPTCCRYRPPVHWTATTKGTRSTLVAPGPGSATIWVDEVARTQLPLARQRIAASARERGVPVVHMPSPPLDIIREGIWYEALSQGKTVELQGLAAIETRSDCGILVTFVAKGREADVEAHREVIHRMLSSFRDPLTPLN